MRSLGGRRNLPVMPQSFIRTAVAALMLCCSAIAASVPLPSALLRQLPNGFEVIASARSNPAPARTFYFVALASRGEAKWASEERAPPRPLLLFEARKGGRYRLAARNDRLILRADEGGINRCDPFEERKIAVKGIYVTIEQGVACGAHWTDYVTFRFDSRLSNYVFDNWRTQSWSLNPSDDPKAEALVSDGRKVVRASGRPVPLARWRRPRD